jgi:hypothetical protein
VRGLPAPSAYCWQVSAAHAVAVVDQLPFTQVR